MATTAQPRETSEAEAREIADMMESAKEAAHRTNGLVTRGLTHFLAGAIVLAAYEHGSIVPIAWGVLVFGALQLGRGLLANVRSGRAG